jgi:hypothetical protein
VIRLGDLFAGVSWVTSAAILIQSTAETEIVNWIIKAVLAGALAITGYYLRDTAKTIRDTKKKADDTELRVNDHDLIISMWVESLGKELDSREGNVGRRHSDFAMANLVTALRRIQERTKEPE